MTRNKQTSQHSPDADDSLALAEETRSRRRERQLKYLRQQRSFLRLAAATEQEPLYWPLRRTG